MAWVPLSPSHTRVTIRLNRGGNRKGSKMINGKKIIGLAASLVMVAGAAACGGSSNTNSSSAASSSSTEEKICTDGQAVTLTVWGPQEDQADDSSWLPTEEKAFEKANPECKITWKNAVVSEGDAGTTVKQDPSAAADVYMFASDQLGTLVQAGAIGSFQGDYLNQIKEKNSDTMIDSVTQDGTVYGVPFTANTWFMYYDSSVFSADDVKSLDTMLKKGKVSFPLTNSWYMWAFYAGAGATLFGDNGTDENADPLASVGDKGTDVTKYLVSLKSNPNFVLDENSSGKDGLADKTVNAIFSGTWDSADVKTALGDNYAAAQLPTYKLDGTDTQMKSFAGSKAVAYNPKSQNVAVAMALAVFLGGTDAQKAHYEMRQIVPSDNTLSSDEEVAKDPAAVAQMNTVANTSVLQPTFAKMSGFWDANETFGKAIYNGDVTADNAETQTQQFVDGLNKAMESAKSE